MTVNLTPIEQRVADLLLEGCETSDIAQATGVSKRTVKAKLNNMFNKFYVHDGCKRVKLAVLLYREVLNGQGAELSLR